MSPRLPPSFAAPPDGETCPRSSPVGVAYCRLEEAGNGVGTRVLELLISREKVTALSYSVDNVVLCHFDSHTSSPPARSPARSTLQLNKREIRLQGLLQFIHTNVWRCLFGKVSTAGRRQLR